MQMTFNIERVKEGMVLANAVRNPNTNAIVATAGTVLNSRYIQILNSNGIKELEIELSQTEIEKYNNPNAVFLLNVDNGIEPTISKTKVEQFKKTITPIRRGRQDILNVQDVITSAAGIKHEITNPTPNPYTKGNLSYKLSSYKTETSIEDSAIRIATYATMVANAYNKQGNIPRDKMIDETEIALAALLHNYGSICKYDEIRSEITIPNLIQHFPALTERATKIIIDKYNPNFIPIYSYTLLRNKAELFESSVIKKMIVNSKENRNGTGPLKSKQLKGDSRSVIGSLIISLCALYDETLMKCIGENSIHEVDEVLSNAYYSGDYDRGLVDLFRKCIPLYPVGTKVLILNEDTYSQEYAVVLDNSQREENYRNPIVLTVPDNQVIDLSKKSRSRIIGLVSDTVEYSTMNLVNANNTSLNGLKRK